MELHQPFQASSETLLHCQSRGVTEDTRNAVCTASSWQRSQWLFSGQKPEKGRSFSYLFSSAAVDRAMKIQYAHRLRLRDSKKIGAELFASPEQLSMPDRQDCQEAVPSPPSNSSLRSEPLASRRRTKRRDVPSLTTWRKQHVSCISLFGGPAEVCRNHKGAAPRACTASMPRKAKSIVRSGGERWFQQQLSSEICKMHSEPISKC